MTEIDRMEGSSIRIDLRKAKHSPLFGGVESMERLWGDAGIIQGTWLDSSLMI